jgi:acetyl esterase/lipase
VARGLVISLLSVLATLMAAAGGLYLYSPPKSLDVLDSIWPGERGGRRVATGIPFSPGAEGKLDIWSSPVSAEGRKPVLIFFYGGAWVKGRRQDYGFVGRAYAARGFVVVLPDYRKVPGVRFPAFVQDGAAAVRWVHDNIERYGGDPDRIVLGGHSAGAYNAIMLALDARYLRSAGVDPTVIKAAAGYCQI